MDGKMKFFFRNRYADLQARDSNVNVSNYEKSGSRKGAKKTPRAQSTDFRSLFGVLCVKVVSCPAS